jgi:hypothetical protein
VIDNLAPSVETAASSTRFFAFVIAAGLGRGAFGVDDALGSAVGWRSDVLGLARAHGLSVDLSALAVRSAGRWIARIDNRRLSDRSLGHRSAGAEWISLVALKASAHRHVILDVADGVLAASSRARVLALILDAGAIGGAVRAEYTLGATAFVRIAVVVSDAHASASTVALLALGIGSARRRLAGIDDLNCKI